MFVTDFECKYRNSFVICQIYKGILHERVGLMYELFLAIRTTAILDQNVVRLVSHKMATIRADVIVLEFLVQFLALLWHLRGIFICFDKEDERNDDGDAIKYNIPFAPATSGNTECDGNHCDESCHRTEGVELALCNLELDVLLLKVVPHLFESNR